jgi:signal transduction histidine kinase
VVELNHQLHAIKKRLERSRNATGNLAHALKTPLTLITQIAGSDELEQFPNIKQALLQQAEAIQQNIERELARARVAGSHVAGRQTNLRPEIDNVVKILTAAYRQKELVVDIDIAPNVVCTIDRQDILELLGNLLENAYKWAAKRIKVTVEQNGDTRITIEDDGPGRSADDMGKLLRRGARADEQVAGHGLGLAIVTEIVEDYQGELAFSRSLELGGLCVSVSIPNKIAAPLR